MRTSTLARRLGAVALTASLGLGAAACSGAESSGSASDSSGSASSSDEGSEPAADEEAEAPSELAAEDFYPAVMAALEDAETFAFETTSTAAGQESTITGEARFSGDAMEMKASSTGAQAMDLVMLDQVIYLKSPDMGMGEKWMKIDLKASEDSLFGMLAKATDPQAMFKAMETPKKLELLGQEEVDGVATNHYRITMDPVQYMKAMGFPAEMSSFLPKELVTEMWVDADDLPRKFAQTVETPAIGGGKPTTSTTEGVYHDYGLDVDIEAPPASETTDAPALPGAA